MPSPECVPHETCLIRPTRQGAAVYWQSPRQGPRQEDAEKKSSLLLGRKRRLGRQCRRWLLLELRRGIASVTNKHADSLGVCFGSEHGARRASDEHREILNGHPPAYI